MNKNISIPKNIFDKIIVLLDYWNVTDYEPHFRLDYGEVMFALMKKKDALELRDVYANIINAESDELRHFARMKYLQKKRDFDNFF